MLTLPFRWARQLASDLRRRKLGALELLELYLARVERYNPRLNAIIATDLDAARERARAAARALARGEVRGPLHGVPMTIKESFDVVGMPTTWGLPELKDNFPARNALVVDRLLAAGAVVFGKTNVPLLLADWQSFNAIYGTTNNPWDPARVPGGSSGGSAPPLPPGPPALPARPPRPPGHRRRGPARPERGRPRAGPRGHRGRGRDRRRGLAARAAGAPAPGAPWGSRGRDARRPARPRG